jgi:hypothetical protein
MCIALGYTAVCIIRMHGRIKAHMGSNAHEVGPEAAVCQVAHSRQFTVSTHLSCVGI